MNKKQNKIWYPVGLLALVLVMAVIALFTDAYPAAIVGTSFITKKYWDQGQALAQKLDSGAGREKVSDQMIRVREEGLLLYRMKVNYDTPNPADELAFYKTGKSQDYKNLIDKYFGSSEELFTEYVVRPEVYEALLRIKYNSDLSANALAFNRAQGILDKIKKGESFEGLAKANSDDKITGQLGGDLGFVAKGQILPELEKAMLKAEVGQVNDKIIISRLGYHIIYPVETAEKDGAKIWHLKHILVKTSGFEKWLDSMLNGFRVWRIK